MNHDAFTFRESYSTHPAAVRRRERMLTEPTFAEKERARSIKRYRKKQQRKAEINVKLVFLNNKKEDQRLARVRHHLARGRDAARIATWENWPVSEVNRLVELCKN